ncbi:MAG: homoserine O-acetyltransferase [Solirubrobacteraceae bacterium]|nr:homoserine O-acetyltransferase [Solirubrobacteraceae bacterium]
MVIDLSAHARTPGTGLGAVRTRREVVATPTDPLALRCGRSLDHVEVAYQTYGELSPAGDNAVVVLHALTADAHAAGEAEGDGGPGWWDSVIGPGRPIDTDRWFVVCANLLGSCLGTTGPASTDPATGRPWGIDFPPITIGDQVAVLRRLGGALGITRYHALVGPSLGGMHAIEWFLAAPEEVEATILIATTSELTTENRAFSAAGRQAILDDPGFEGGRYLETGGAGPERGLAAARRFAHITYVSSEALERKLGDPAPAGAPPRSAAEWLAPGRAVETYLEHQGQSFLRRFDALSYLFLTRPMDDFAPFGPANAEAACRAVARNPTARHLVLSFDSDWRFGTSHAVRLAARLRAAGARAVEHQELAAPWGHDSFLLETPGMGELIARALAD